MQELCNCSDQFDAAYIKINVGPSVPEERIDTLFHFELWQLILFKNVLSKKNWNHVLK